MGGDTITVNGYEWWGYSQENLSLKIQPNFYNGLTTFGDTDVIQVSLLTDAFIKQDDVLTPLSDVIPQEFIHVDGVAHEDKTSIDLSDVESLNPSVVINPHNYTGIFVNAGPDYYIHTFDMANGEFSSNRQDFDINFTESGVQYTTSNPLFSDASFNVKITDAQGGQWISSDGLSNGAGGSGKFYPDSLNFPINVQAEVYQADDFTGSSTIFNYFIESSSGNISDPNNEITLIPTQVFIPAYSSMAPDGSILSIPAISADEHGLTIKPSPLDDIIYVDNEEGDWPIIEWSAGNDYIVGPSTGAALKGKSYHDWSYQSDLEEGLTFEFNDNVLTVASEYGVIKAENIRNIYGSRGDDIMIGNENFQDFRVTVVMTPT